MAKTQGMSEEGKEKLSAELVVDKKGLVRMKGRENKSRRRSQKRGRTGLL
jgi:hypothetical protein